MAHSTRSGPIPAKVVRDLIDGIAARDVPRHCDAALSGYMGDAAIGAAIMRWPAYGDTPRRSIAAIR